MKRRSDTNLVYPFGTKQKFLMPPFISDKGFVTEKEGQSTVLSLDVAKPLDFTTSGQLGVKVGPGLHLTPEGALALDSDLNSISAVDPVEAKDGEVSLKMADGLTTTPQGELTLKTLAPLDMQKGSLHITADETLTIADGKLGVRLAQPLVPTPSGVSLAVGQGLTLSGGALSASHLTAAGALKVRNNEITLNTDLMFSQNEGKLTLVTQNPISTEDGALELKTGNEFDSSGGVLTLKLSPELQRTPDGALALRLQDPVTLNTQNRITLQTGSGLAVTGGVLTVAYGAGLETDNTVEENSAKLKVKPGNGLTISSSGALQVKTGNGVFFDSTGGLSIDPINSLKVADPLLKNGNTVSMKFGKGLTVTKGELAVKPGYLLDFDDAGKLMVSQPPIQTQTLWTPPTLTANIKTSERRIFLCLSQCGGLVQGVAQLEGTGSERNFKKNEVFGLDFHFNAKGELMRDISHYDGPWGYRGAGDKANEVDPDIDYNRLKLMPNTLLYPTNTEPEGIAIIVNTVILSPKDNALDAFHPTVRCAIQLNRTRPEAGGAYAIRLQWGPFPSRADKLTTSPANFSYVSAQ